MAAGSSTVSIPVLRSVSRPHNGFPPRWPSARRHLRINVVHGHGIGHVQIEHYQIRSAVSSEPISFSMCSARAPSIVAISRAPFCSERAGIHTRVFCSFAASPSLPSCPGRCLLACRAVRARPRAYRRRAHPRRGPRHWPASCCSKDCGRSRPDDRPKSSYPCSPPDAMRRHNVRSQKAMRSSTARRSRVRQAIHHSFLISAT